jgi:2-polyprenyl-3-methyl-5-hydroxy-6-metoxy-1,4-benzoquinol methylase
MENFFQIDDYFKYLKKNFDLIQKNKIDYFCTRSDLKVFNYYLNKLNISKNKSLLECGCGLGRILNLIKKKFNNKNLDLYGIDVSKKAIEYAKNKLKKLKKNIYNLKVEEISKLKTKFDIIICWGVFDLTKQEIALKQIINNLNLNGEILISGKNNNYQFNDTDAIEAEIACRKKKIPNSFTDFDLLEKFIKLSGCKIKHKYFFVKRGDASKNKFNLEKPAKFYEYILIVKKIKNIKRIKKLKICSKFSKTFRLYNV